MAQTKWMDALIQAIIEDDNFDIIKWEEGYQGLHPMLMPCLYLVSPCEIGIDGVINKDYAIAIAKHFKLTS